MLCRSLRRGRVCLICRVLVLLVVCDLGMRGLTWEMWFRRECRGRCQGRVVHLGAAIERVETTISTMQMLRASGRRIQRLGSGWS